MQNYLKLHRHKRIHFTTDAMSGNLFEFYFLLTTLRLYYYYNFTDEIINIIIIRYSKKFITENQVTD